MKEFFFPELDDQKTAPNIIQCSDAGQSQIIRGMQMYTIVKLLRGMQSNYWGGYIPSIPPDFGTPTGERQ